VNASASAISFNITFLSISGNVRRSFAVEVQQVECDEDALPAPEKQVTKHGTASLINTGNLTVYDRAFNAKMFGDPCGKVSKTPGTRFHFSRSALLCPLKYAPMGEAIDL
jgi:hypothetical protein